MSHYTEVETSFKDCDCLVKALQDLGYHPEVGKDLPLYGFQGDRRSQTADIVVRRREVGGAANDAGWVWDPVNKSYTQIISEYDISMGRLKPEVVKRAYAPHIAIKAALKHGFKVVAKKQEGQRLHLTLRR